METCTDKCRNIVETFDVDSGIEEQTGRFYQMQSH